MREFPWLAKILLFFIFFSCKCSQLYNYIAAVRGVSGAFYYCKGGENYFIGGTFTGNLISFNYDFKEIVSDIS